MWRIAVTPMNNNVQPRITCNRFSFAKFVALLAVTMFVCGIAVIIAGSDEQHARQAKFMQRHPRASCTIDQPCDVVPYEGGHELYCSMTIGDTTDLCQMSAGAYGTMVTKADAYLNTTQPCFVGADGIISSYEHRRSLSRIKNPGKILGVVLIICAFGILTGLAAMVR